jgi:hypothetical protein
MRSRRRLATGILMIAAMVIVALLIDDTFDVSLGLSDAGRLVLLVAILVAVGIADRLWTRTRRG